MIPLEHDQQQHFAAPWEAHVFALCVKLSQQGLFTWREWTEALAAEVAGCAHPGYGEWLSALEKLLVANGTLSEPERNERIAAWDRAARATPHGQPIELSRA